MFRELASLCEKTRFLVSGWDFGLAKIKYVLTKVHNRNTAALHQLKEVPFVRKEKNDIAIHRQEIKGE